MCRGKNINSPSLSVFFRSLIMLYLSLRPAVFLLICKESPSLYWMPKHASKLTSLRLPSRLILLFWTSLHHECSLHILNNLCQKRFGHIEGLLAIIEVVDLAVHDHSVRSTGRLVTWLGVAFTGPKPVSAYICYTNHEASDCHYSRLLCLWALSFHLRLLVSHFRYRSLLRLLLLGATTHMNSDLTKLIDS
ncbi:hypothetical protein ES332_A03G174500v1 [Gossypium tomentosum]|uniref:Uncharacterized protein n=1 Tax=Gossypium tomentosum TaxID=34277 RepID=A0A5D2R849_GOSTO|nr:hypothetical protein ES332_A03G174500v1 [Gossypium tomentosum]